MKRRNGRKDKYWQCGDTGRVCISWYKPSARWSPIPKHAYDKICAAMGNHEPVGVPGASSVEMQGTTFNPKPVPNWCDARKG